MPAPTGSSQQLDSLAEQLLKLDAGLAAYKRENELLQRRVKVLEEKVSGLDKRASVIGLGLSLGLSVPTTGAESLCGMVSAHVKWLTASYYVGRGAGLSIRFMEIEVANRVRVHPLAIGAIYYLDASQAFSERWLKRAVDIVVPVGLDVRVWKGLSVGVQASWFLPPVLEIPSGGDDVASEASQSAKDLGELWLGVLSTPRIGLHLKWSI